jgi:1-phosphatidylinositol-4-phosphate 5-kinase
MPARACRQLTETGSNAAHSDEHICEVYDVVVCMGIIDILTQYNASKRLEHAYKSLQFDSVSISVVDPRFYSERFQSFIASAFLEEDFER